MNFKIENRIWKGERRLNRTLNIENQTNSFLKITKSPIRFASIKVRMKERANSEKKDFDIKSSKPILKLETWVL